MERKSVDERYEHGKKSPTKYSIEKNTNECRTKKQKGA
jgi:hypothetical protein